MRNHPNVMIKQQTELQKEAINEIPYMNEIIENQAGTL